jgi:hypothetical protein
MKITFILVVLGLFFEFVAPHYLGNRITNAQIQLPQFIWTKSAPRIYDFSFSSLFRIMGAVLLTIAIIYYFCSCHKPAS